MTLHTTLPSHSGNRSTTRLGLGTATLMREPSARKRRYVLDAAYAVGVRHYDTAPLYGLGVAERELGAFLRDKAECTVATKFGLAPSTIAKLAAKVQQPIRAVLRSSSALRRLAQRTGDMTRVAADAPSIDAVRLSIRASLETLQRERIDVVLMHDLAWQSSTPALWADIGHADFSSVGAFGLAGDAAVLDTYSTEFLERLLVLQTAAPVTRSITGPRTIQFGVISQTRASTTARFERSPALRAQFEDAVGHPLRTAQQLSAFVACVALAQSADSILLIGTTKAEHMEQLWSACEADLPSLEASELAALLPELSEPGTS